jgi:hypothetical protein
VAAESKKVLSALDAVLGLLDLVLGAVNPVLCARERCEYFHEIAHRFSQPVDRVCQRAN